MKEITFQIDGRTFSASPDATVLEVARENDIFIPSLCYFPGLTSVGACRLCMVEARGVPRLLPACVTKVAEGMSIATDTPRLRRYRRMALELLFAERNHLCAVCVSSGHCELQTLAAQCGMTHTRFVYRYPKLAVDTTHARFGYDPNRCILCGRCLRACSEVEGARTWNFAKRGIRSVAITDLNEPWGASTTCTSCGKCVNVCPTGALFDKGKAVGEMVKHTDILDKAFAGRTGDGSTNVG